MTQAKTKTGRRMKGWTQAVVVLLLFVFGCSTGCVRRRMTIRSNPPGALVYVDDYEIGTTPVSTSFVYYGTRKIRLVKSGYETLTVYQRFDPPWYEWFPIDFVSENLIPWELRDVRTIDFQLVPQRIVPTEELLQRGENLRQRRRMATPPVVPPSPAGGLPVPMGAAPAGVVPKGNSNGWQAPATLPAPGLPPTGATRQSGPPPTTSVPVVPSP